MIPAGPNNPLGRYALRLAHGNGEYLIHGTSAPDSVGLRVSSGCIRMNAPDIKALFAQVETGTPVKVINQPVKFSVEPNGIRYVEVHRPLSPEEEQNVQTMPYVLPAEFTAFRNAQGVDSRLVDKALYRRAGYPVSVSAGQTPAVNTTAVESAQNGFVGKRGKRARRSSLRANDGQKMAHDVRHFISCVKLFTGAGYFVVQTLVSASSIVFSSLNVGTHCIYVITQLINFSAQRLYIGRQLIDFSVA